MKFGRDLYTSLGVLCLVVFASLACGIGDDKNDRADATNTATPSDSKSSNSKSTNPSAKSGVTVDKIELAKDDGKGDAGDTVSSFKSSDNPLHFVAHMSEFESGTKIKMVLTAIEAGGSKNEKVGELEKETTAFENVLDAHWQLPGGWPTGRYKIEAFVNGNLDKTLEFEIT